MALMSPEGLLAIPSGKSPDCTASVTLLGFEVDPSNASCTAVLSSASDRLRPLLGAKVGSRSVAGGTPSSFIQFVEQLSGDEMGFNGVSLILAVSPFLSSLERIRSPGELRRRVWGPDSASGVLFGCPLETLGDTPAYPLAGLALQCLQILRARRLPADPPPPSPLAGVSDEAFWSQVCKLERSTEDACRAALLAVPPTDPDYQYFQECAERVGAPDTPSLHGGTARP